MKLKRVSFKSILTFITKRNPEYLLFALLFLWFVFSVAPLPFVQCSDGYFVWSPRLSYAVSEILSGQMPFWNEFQFGGTSLLADGNTNILNPMTVFYLFMDFAWAYTLGVLVIFCVLIVGTWLYFRERDFSKTASVIGTIGYTLGGQITFWSLYHGMNLCLALFPLTLFAFRKFEKANAKQDGSRNGHTVQIRWKLLAFFAMFISALGGFIQFAFIAAVSVILEGIEEFSLESAIRAVKSRCLTVLLAVASASVVIIPTIEASIFSHRKLVPYFQALLADGFPLWSMIFWGSSFEQHDYPNYFYYIGVVLIALSFFTIRKHFRKTVADPFFIYSLIFPSILIVIYLEMLPTSFQFGVESDPWRGMFVFILSLSILAAGGADLYIRKIRNENRLVLPPFELMLGSLISLVVYGVKVDHADRTNIMFLGVLIISGFILSVVLKREENRVKTVVFSAWLVSLMIVNSLVPAGLYLSRNVIRKPLSAWEKRDLPVEMFSNEGRFMAIGYETVGLEDWGIFHKIRAIGGYGSFFPKLVFTRMRDEGLSPSSLHAATHFRNNSNRDPDILARYGVLYLIRGRSANIGIGEGWELIKSLQDSLIYINRRYVGRAYVIDKEGNILKGAKLVENTNSYVRMSVNTNAGDTLILADSWFPGWKCYDNGEEVEGFNADGFRGCQIETSGRHEIEWIYRFPSFFVGLVISIISLVAFSLLVLWQLSSNKKKEARS